MFNRKQLIQKYLEFFKSKGHKEIPNSSLIPENDPTVLFTTAGMHPLVPFLLGQKHPLGKRLCNIQRCIRTGDIEEVGDTKHHTFFEQLGNWSLGDYFKEDALKFTFEFVTKELKIPLDELAGSVFAGNKNSPKDSESFNTLISIGLPKESIAFLDDNWWGPAGKTGPCGPCSEIFYWRGEKPAPKKFNPNDENWVEVGNNVFLQYNKDAKENYISLKQKNVDFGGGSERMLAILDGSNDNYQTDCFLPIIKEIEKLSGKKYSGNEREMRIIADHIKASVFIISDGVSPGNSEQSYVLRRLIRRAIRYGRELGMKDFTTKIAEPVFKIYDDYDELKNNKQKILNELKQEEERFQKTIELGIKKFKEIASSNKKINCKDSFLLYQSYGFPLEMIEEECKKNNIKFSKEEFEKECQTHQELSRTASAGMFKSGLADNSVATTKLHTAAHLLLAALKKVLKDENIIQRGSNITPERIRFDFSFPKKLTDEEIKKVEDEVNDKIKKGIKVVREELSLDDAKKQKATGVFEKKYGDIVSVYTIRDCSKEICTGPHVTNTSELGKFKILKEESSSSGIRRIKAVLED